MRSRPGFCWMTAGTMAGAPRTTRRPRSGPRSSMTPPAASSRSNKSPDLSFDQSINPYRGCEHGCIYCFARPTHAYLGMSPGVDFESRLFAKPNAAELLAKELSAPGYVPKVIAMGTNTDPYQPLEKKMRITRSHPGSAARLPPSRRHRHQVAADPARPRYPVRHGGDGPGQGGAVGHHAGPQAGADDGAARRHARRGGCRRSRGSAMPAFPPA